MSTPGRASFPHLILDLDHTLIDSFEYGGKHIPDGDEAYLSPIVTDLFMDEFGLPELYDGMVSGVKVAIKLRPGARRFIREMSKDFLLHVYTKGALRYMQEVVHLLELDNACSPCQTDVRPPVGIGSVIQGFLISRGIDGDQSGCAVKDIRRIVGFSNKSEISNGVISDVKTGEIVHTYVLDDSADMWPAADISRLSLVEAKKYTYLESSWHSLRLLRGDKEERSVTGGLVSVPLSVIDDDRYLLEEAAPKLLTLKKRSLYFYDDCISDVIGVLKRRHNSSSLSTVADTPSGERSVPPSPALSNASSASFLERAEGEILRRRCLMNITNDHTEREGMTMDSPFFTMNASTSHHKYIRGDGEESREEDEAPSRCLAIALSPLVLACQRRGAPYVLIALLSCCFMCITVTAVYFGELVSESSPAPGSITFLRKMSEQAVGAVESIEYML